MLQLELIYPFQKFLLEGKCSSNSSAKGQVYFWGIFAYVVKNKCAGTKSVCASCQTSLCCAGGAQCRIQWLSKVVPCQHVSVPLLVTHTVSVPLQTTYLPFRSETFPNRRACSLQALLQFPWSRTHSSSVPSRVERGAGPKCICRRQKGLWDVGSCVMEGGGIWPSCCSYIFLQVIWSCG